jgi:methionyl-tRNA formyltransferase
MKFNKINHIIVFGGSQLTLEFLKLLKRKKINFHYFTNKRQLLDILSNNLNLRDHLKKNKIKFYETEDINKNELLKKISTKKSLGIGFGQPWKFKQKILKLMNPNLVDFMGIPMPKFRGGAHYTWMILKQYSRGGCFIQNIDRNTVQGSSDSGYYYDSIIYKYPKKLKYPKDYFKYSIKKEINFLKNFLKKINNNVSFKLKKIDERKSNFYPRLLNYKNGFINWNWLAKDIVTFINGFGDPYLGAISYFNEKRFYLKEAKLVYKNNLHSFLSGTIIKKNKKKLHIQANKGIIEVNIIYNNNDSNIMSKFKIGDKFYNIQQNLDNSKQHLRF